MQKPCNRHVLGSTILAECHDGWVCRGCYEEVSMRAECEMCHVRICGVKCESYLRYDYAYNGYMIVCETCKDKPNKRAENAPTVPTNGKTNDKNTVNSKN